MAQQYFIESNVSISNFAATLDQDIATVQQVEYDTKDEIKNADTIFIVADELKTSFEVISEKKGTLFIAKIDKKQGCIITPKKLKKVPAIDFFRKLSNKRLLVNYKLGMYPLHTLFLVKEQHERIAKNSCQGENLNLNFQVWLDSIQETIAKNELDQSEYDNFINWLRRAFNLTTDELKLCNVVKSEQSNTEQWKQDLLALTKKELVTLCELNDVSFDKKDNKSQLIEKLVVKGMETELKRITEDDNTSDVLDNTVDYSVLNEQTTIDGLTEKLNDFSKSQLVELCKMHDLSHKGNKTVVTEILLQHYVTLLNIEKPGTADIAQNAITEKTQTVPVTVSEN